MKAENATEHYELLKLEVGQSACSELEQPNLVDTQEEEKGKSASPLTRKHKILLFMFALSEFSSNLAFATISPFFPHEATAKGASAIEIGLIFGVFQLVVFIVSPLYGSLIPKFGVKFMYTSGLFMCCICITLFGFLDGCPPGVVFVALCFICRIIDANGTAMISTAGFAILVHTFPDHISLVLGLTDACVALGEMAGPPIGGFLYEVGGFKLPFLVVGGVLLFAFVVSCIIVPHIGSLSKGKSPHVLLKIPEVLLASSNVYGCNLQLSFLDPVLSKRILAINPSLGAAAVGGIFLVDPAMYSILAPLVGYVCGKAGSWLKCVMVIGSAIATASGLLLGPTPLLPMLSKSQWILIGSLALNGIGLAGCWLPSYQFCIDAVIKRGYAENVDTYGMVGGLLGSATALGAFTGPLLGSFLVDRIGFSWATTCLAGLTLLMVFANGSAILLPKLMSALARFFRFVNLKKEETGPLLTLR